VRSGPGAARTILLFQSLVLGPLNSLLWYVPSLRYTRGLGWSIHCGAEVTGSNTNKQHLSLISRQLSFYRLGICAELKDASSINKLLGAPRSQAAAGIVFKLLKIQQEMGSTECLAVLCLSISSAACFW